MTNADLFWRGSLTLLVAYILYLWWCSRGGR